MRPFCSFECEACRTRAVMTGISADEDGKLYLDTTCPTCRKSFVVTTSAEELFQLNANQPRPTAPEPRYLM